MGAVMGAVMAIIVLSKQFIIIFFTFPYNKHAFSILKINRFEISELICSS